VGVWQHRHDALHPVRIFRQCTQAQQRFGLSFEGRVGRAVRAANLPPLPVSQAAKKASATEVIDVVADIASSLSFEKEVYHGKHFAILGGTGPLPKSFRFHRLQEVISLGSNFLCCNVLPGEPIHFLL
jgi:hypothetical protein